jgi:hypothetical protein
MLKKIGSSVHSLVQEHENLSVVVNYILSVQLLIWFSVTWSTVELQSALVLLDHAGHALWKWDIYFFIY